ncbi:choice-of-anchor Q domain-containing protein [Streptomyces sp. NPDC001980]|uniref:choice-of-anchor Q domain-containing protein n=1 Tax=Streptomyces sp. NPDC001980 TaxID=3157126 RepID=UPI0033225B10
MSGTGRDRAPPITGFKTVAQNTAIDGGGTSRIFVVNGSPTLTLSDITLNGAPAGAAGTVNAGSGAAIHGSGGTYNLTNARLGTLTNDGPNTTWYALPVAGSPLINAAVPKCSTTEQCHASRPDGCDIGAEEFGGSL